MIQLEFTEEVTAELQHLRFHYPHPRVQRKMEALWLKSQGMKHRDIARFTGVSGETLHSYFLAYQQGGIEQLKQSKTYRPSSLLMEHRESLEAYFADHPPVSVKEAANAIETLTGIKRSSTQVRAFLKGIGMQCRKVGVVPAKADPDIQDEFKKKS